MSISNSVKVVSSKRKDFQTTNIKKNILKMEKRKITSSWPAKLAIWSAVFPWKKKIVNQHFTHF